MKRPLVITIICIIGYLAALLNFPQVFSPSIKKLGMIMPAVYGLIVAANFISCVGLWYFKQWGVVFFISSFFAKTLFLILTHQLGISFAIGCIINCTFIIILLRFYSKMNPNL